LKIGEAFYQRIAKPIGMQDFQPGDVYYIGGPISVHRGYPFEITARDLARCVTDVGTANRLCRKPGSRKAATPTRW
jgi:hypothetical protein